MPWLSKSDYIKFLIHPAYLWLQKFDKAKLPAATEADQFTMDQGNAVESVARQLFPQAVLIDESFQDGVKKTAELAQGQVTLFQASVLTDRQLYARADVLVGRGTSWELWEVKSSTKVKDDHIHDLAFQRIAFEDAGYNITKTGVIFIDRQYVFDGQLDAKGFLKRRDVTVQVENLLPDTRDRIEQALAVLKSPRCPDFAPYRAGNLGAWMRLYRHLHPELAVDSAFNLCRLRPWQTKLLAESAITRLADVPLSFRLSGPQRAQLELVRLGRPSVHAGKIAHRLQKLKFPLYFLDYETTAPAIPLWEKVRPYQAVPFQYSLHILQEDGSLEQKEFLSQNGDYPVPALLKQLKQDLGPSGSVIVWFAAFEAGCNLAMADLEPDYASFLRAVNRRIFDLMTIFSEQLYGHPDFFGSASIKKVLPVVVPSMNYKELSIQEGNTASVRWTKAARGELTPEQAAAVYADLLTYCGQDTLAMVKIYQFLQELIFSKKIK